MKHDRPVIVAFIFRSVLIILLVSCGGKRSDDAILRDVSDSLKFRSNNYSEVTAEVKDGEIHLSGTCLGEIVQIAFPNWLEA